VTKLQFRFKDVIDEVSALSGVARPFIAPDCRYLLEQLKTSLEGLQGTSQTSSFIWGIPARSPLRTVTSEGAYQRGGGGAHRICAEITSKWQIKRIPARRRHVPATVFELDGAASTRVRIFDMGANDERGRELAMWRMEVGDEAHPGCHFHVQVLGEIADGPFPPSLDVPRLPSLIATPPAVLEYVLGEIFQDEWPRRIASEQAALTRWSVIQQARLDAILTWHLQIVRNAPTAPWPALKQAKPHATMFSAGTA
jgi:hypothetical protein